MNTMSTIFRQLVFLGLLLIGLVAVSFAQKSEYRIEVEPAKPVMNVGESLKLKVTVYDSNGKKEKNPTLRFFSRDAKVAGVDRRTGEIKALKGGVANVIVLRPDPDGRRARYNLEVKVNFPVPTEIRFMDPPKSCIYRDADACTYAYPG